MELKDDIQVDIFCEAFMAMIQSAISSKSPIGMETNLEYKIKLLLYGITKPY